MPSKKTIEDYVYGIREKHNQIKEYPNSKELQKKYPDIDTLHSQLDTQIRGWVKNLNITIYIAQNEQLDWKPEEFKDPEKPDDLKLTFKPMLKKSENGHDQVGDYQACYSGAGVSGWIPVLVERKGGKKGCEDLYATLTNPEHCKTFYKELDRFYADPRFTQMIVITECSLSQFMLYAPLFNGKKRNVKHIGASPESRGGKIDSLFIRGVPVLFAGTRSLAIKRYKGILKTWLRLNYASVLKLDVEPYNDTKFLQEKLSRLEVEIEATKAALGVVV